MKQKNTNCDTLYFCAICIVLCSVVKAESPCIYIKGKLDCSLLTTRELVKNIPEIENTTELILTGQYIETLSWKMFVFYNTLQRLSLEKCSLAQIYYNAFCNLTDLTYINLSYNHISLLDPLTFSWNTKLETLDLQHNEIFQLSENIFQNLTELVYIDLSRNKLRRLGKNLFKHNKNIQYLSLEYNHLIEFQFDSQFKKLTNLNIAGNQLTAANNNIQLQENSLILFKLSNNNISTIGENLLKYTRTLYILYLNVNFLERLETVEFRNTSHLEELHLRYNRIKYIDENFFSIMPNLKILDIGNNRLTTFTSSSLYGLTKLSELHLKGNILTCDYRLLELQSNLLSNNARSRIVSDQHARFLHANIKNMLATELLCEPNITITKSEYNGTIIISCQVEAYPRPNITFEQNNTIINETFLLKNRDYQLSSNLESKHFLYWLNLTITKENIDKETEIFCVANNVKKSTNVLIENTFTLHYIWISCSILAGLIVIGLSALIVYKFRNRYSFQAVPNKLAMEPSEKNTASEHPVMLFEEINEGNRKSKTSDNYYMTPIQTTRNLYVELSTAIYQQKHINQRSSDSSTRIYPRVKRNTYEEINDYSPHEHLHGSRQLISK